MFLGKDRCKICSDQKIYRHNICRDCLERLDLVHRKSLKEIDNIDRLYYSASYSNFGLGIVKDFKFKSSVYLEKVIAPIMLETFLKNKIEVDLIYFVPIHKRRRLERGYNQSQILAEYISENTAIELGEGLRKIKNTRPQSLLKNRERKSNLKDAFYLDCKIKGKKVLLVDDIITTGSTMKFLGEELRLKGAQEIVGLSFISI